MRSGADERQQNLKRLAVLIVAQLPAGERDALAVLDYARELVLGFLAAAPPRRPTVVKPFVLRQTG